MVFELYAFDEPADLAVTPEDFARPATLIGGFEPGDGIPVLDANQLTFDVTDVVDVFVGSNVGFRVQIQGDLELDDPFNGLRDWPPRLYVKPVPEPAATLQLAAGLLGLIALRARSRRT